MNLVPITGDTFLCTVCVFLSDLVAAVKYVINSLYNVFYCRGVCVLR